MEELRRVIVDAASFSHFRTLARIFFVIFAVFVLLGFVLFFSTLLYVERYAGLVYPGVRVGNYDLGGLSAVTVKNFIENINNRYAKEGIELIIAASDGVNSRNLFKPVSGSDATEEVVRLDSDALSALALSAGRAGNIRQRLLLPVLYGFIKPHTLLAPTTANDAAFRAVLAGVLKGQEDPAKNAAVVFDFPETDMAPRVVPEKAGLTFEYPAIERQIKEAMGRLSFAPIFIPLRIFQPTITVRDIEPALAVLSRPLIYGDLSFNYIDPETKMLRAWALSRAELAVLSEVRRDDNGTIILALQAGAVKKYLADFVKPMVDAPPREAKFVFENDKVKEFQASRTGLLVDLDKTYNDFDAAFRARNYAPSEAIKTVSVSVIIAEPKVKTADVNNLGITDVLGAGVSTFKDSHTNRIKNIAHAAERLNGTLIKPGEIFSANKAAGPFTADNGYLPEQVIKGREIKPEIGGGMCQIGTTLFRMAMNSGMDVTQRRNHSLVVSYYADPVNGNPGTDATLYEPDLDLKFINDTGRHLLLQTDIDYKKQQLVFTLWGNPDGRSGSYTHPLVSRWIPAGDQEQILVDDGALKPGEKKCQTAFRGAVASFTYTRVTPQGEKIERGFDSYYRPLPKICLVGAEPGTCPSGGCLPTVATSTKQ
ncbi:MAG: VanW family protein [Parcubacteria group bacterium GW2011_GWA2_53_21]|nr:MAG: VanW family protein [Parcubacteria group bacterium GW2011_GWA2_53_21]